MSISYEKRVAGLALAGVIAAIEENMIHSKEYDYFVEDNSSIKGNNDGTPRIFFHERE
jgi:hypothetical protein